MLVWEISLPALLVWEKTHTKIVIDYITPPLLPLSKKVVIKANFNPTSYLIDVRFE
jgi:hypothetical protein